MEHKLNVYYPRVGKQATALFIKTLPSGKSLWDIQYEDAKLIKHDKALDNEFIVIEN